MDKICGFCGASYFDLPYDVRRAQNWEFNLEHNCWFCSLQCKTKYVYNYRQEQISEAYDARCEADRKAFDDKHNKKIESQQRELDLVKEQSINIDGFLYSPDRTTLIQCPKLTRNYTVPEGVIEIFAEAFSGCDRLEKVILPQGLKIIGREAFANCTNLKSIEISDGLEEIGELAFFNCKALTSITFPASLKLIQGGKEADYLPGGNLDLKARAAMSYPDRHREIIKNMGLQTFEEALRNITEDHSEKGMEIRAYYYGAFIGCDNLEEVTISGKETIIGDFAFWKCSNLQKLNGTGKVIGNYAFSDCSSLTNVIFSDSTEEILDEAFARTAINGPVDLPAIKVIGETAFRLCPLTSVVIGKEIDEIRDKAFAYCGKLADTEDDPDSGMYSSDLDSGLGLYLDFGGDGEKPYGKGCLQNIHFPETVKEIQSNWFEDSGVKSLTISASVESFEIDNRIIKTIYIENGEPSRELLDQLSQYDVVVKRAETNKVIIEGKYISPVSKENESKSDSGGRGFLGLFGKKKR